MKKDTFSSREKRDSGLYDGFSHRFNYLLDSAGYPSMNQGRLTEFAEDMEMSVSGARKWIVEDNPPKKSKLVEVCEKVISENFSSSLNARRVAAWLEYGDDIVENPFSSGRSIIKDHLIMGKIYVSIHNMAEELEIDISQINPSLRDSVYCKVMDDVVSNNLNEPDKKFICSLLILAEKESI